MHTCRITNRLPQVHRVLKVTPVNTTPATRKMSLFPRFVANEFAPMFRLMDDYANHVMTTGGREGSFGPALGHGLTRFQPKFDIKENSDNYELHGELPGIAQENINIEFTDPQTLTIKGQTETVREEGQRPGAIEGQQEQAKITEAGENSTKHATVEDENAPEQASEAAPTPAESTTTEVASQQTPQAPQSKYWMRELSRGSFSRTFSFPSRVDQENVKASLKNGILSIVVPKAAAPQHKRINIE
jgi:HSP20 family protein